MRALLEAIGTERKMFWENPTRGDCAEQPCVEKNPILFETSNGKMVCATHYRIQSNRKLPYPCDRCGRPGAFRDPLHRRDEYFCASCHEDDGYIPTERAMITKVQARQGVTHSRGRRPVCIAAGHGTDCGGEVKQRGRVGLLCNKHHDPKKYLANRSE